MDSVETRAKRLFEWALKHAKNLGVDISPSARAMIEDAYEVSRYVLNESHEGMQDRRQVNPDRVGHEWKCRCQTYNAGGDIVCKKCGLFKDSEKNIR